MPSALFGDMLRSMLRVCATDDAHDLSDGELLERFLAQRTEAAFAVLVQRHGPMVLGVCQRVLGDSHGAEDAFQATFLVLVRRAASVRSGSLGSWLHAVALRVAMKARAQTPARRHRERQATQMPEVEPLDHLAWHELRAVLDEEIGNLPDKYRRPLVLCYLDGMTYEQAARELAWPKSSLANRLAKARELLRRQLTRRGIALSAAALATALAERATGTAVTALLTLNTVRAATSLIAGKVPAACLSGRAVSLADEALKGMPGIKGKTLVVALVLGLALGGFGLAAQVGLDVQAPPAKEQAAAPAAAGQSGQNANVVVNTDLYGDPLPDGATARLGTVRFRMGLHTKALAFSPNDKILAGPVDFGFGPCTCFWDAATGKPSHRLSSSWNSSLAFSADGKLLFTNTSLKSLGLIDVATGKEARRFQGPALGRFGVVAFAPDGQTVAAAGGETQLAQIKLWEVATGNELRKMEWKGDVWVWSLAIAPDGKTLASGDDDQTIRLWDTATGKELRYWHATDAGRVGFVAYAPDSKVLVSAGEDWAMRVWNVETGTLVRQIKGDIGNMRNIAMSRDGKLLASGGRNGIIYLWEVSTGKEIRRWQAHGYDVNSLAFSSDGKILASSGQGDTALRRWDTASGKEIDPIGGHSGRIDVLRFTPDGKKLWSCGRDSQVREWDLATSRQSNRYFAGPMGPTEGGWRSHAGDLSLDGTLIVLLGRRAGRGGTRREADRRSR
jgi:RNA polymerase sigma factor (sigma-70 family)